MHNFFFLLLVIMLDFYLLKYVQKHFTRCISVRANSRRYSALNFDWHTSVHYDRVPSLKQENASSTLYHHVTSDDDRF